MKKLYFVAKWNKDDITKTWSGTTYSLYKGLSKYFDIIKVNSPNNLFFHRLNQLRLRSNWTFFDWAVRIYTNFYLRRQIKDKTIPVFCIGFSEFQNPTFVYIDDLLLSKKKLHNKIEREYGRYTKKKIEIFDRHIRKEYELIQKTINVFCMGKWIVEFVKTNYPEFANKFIEAPGGCNANVTFISNMKKKGERNKILFIGWDYKRKGLALVLEAYKILKKERRNLRLIIAGPPQNPLLEEIEDVSFLGIVSYDKIGELMRDCDLFCMPSYYEAFGLVFVESLLSGLPCIGRNQQEMPYFIQEGETGELVDNDNPLDLASKMKKILDNDNYYHNVRANNSSYLKQYNWDNTCITIRDYILKNG